MKFILAALLCVLAVVSAVAQTEKTGFSKSAEKNGVKKLTLARQDSEGNIEENIEIFSTNDVPIFCYVDLISTVPTSVQLNLIAVKVKGLRPNTKIISISYKTKKGEDAVTFTGKPENDWIVGSYRVDILLNGKLAKSREFSVEMLHRSAK
ncbi:MAG: hypothetical protein HKN25_14720 [Pyrinomonadaceae bacterium]|nr:hypothetical protein [Pyrinomonadaceae bacterium]